MKKFVNQELKQVNCLDERFYTIDGKTFYPSVTHILDIYPKGFGFNQWLKDVGNNASDIAERAAEIGSNVHNATEYLHTGEPIYWFNENGQEEYSEIEWQMIMRYKEFWDKCQPKLLANENSMISKQYGFGGTIDRVLEIGGKRWLVDLKTSNYLHTVNELQVAAYAIMWNELNPNEPIEETAILWLKAKTRSDKIDLSKDIYQGSGWQLKTFSRHYMDAFEIFKHAHAIYKEENPNPKPKNKVYPTEIKI